MDERVISKVRDCLYEKHSEIINIDFDAESYGQDHHDDDSSSLFGGEFVFTIQANLSLKVKVYYSSSLSLFSWTDEQRTDTGIKEVIPILDVYVDEILNNLK